MSKTESVPFGTTLKVRDTCLCLHAQRAARALARRYDEALRPLQITSGQFSLMMALNRPDPPAMGPVASLLAMDRTTLTANLKPLERRGLIRVMADTTDRRSRRMMLTEAGQRLLTAALPVWEQTQADVEARVRSDPDTLRAVLLALS
jgi:DNA-binding MarR family transcriptional regulator